MTFNSLFLKLDQYSKQFELFQAYSNGGPGPNTRRMPSPSGPDSILQLKHYPSPPDVTSK